jgi:hypothetical protein
VKRKSSLRRERVGWADQGWVRPYRRMGAWSASLRRVVCRVAGLFQRR